MIAPDLADDFRGKAVLVTGGLGFIGSTLARELVVLGANVVLIDSLIPEYGGSRANIEGLESDVEGHISDVRDGHALKGHVCDRGVIFNLAGQASPLAPMI